MKTEVEIRQMPVMMQAFGGHPQAVQAMWVLGELLTSDITPTVKQVVK